MKDKIECMIVATLIVLFVCTLVFLSVCFIAWAVGLAITRYLLTSVLLIYAIYIIYRAMNPKHRYYFVSYVHAKGFGALSLRTQGYLVRKEAEAFINQENFGGTDSIVILYYKELSKKEYEVRMKGNRHDTKSIC